MTDSQPHHPGQLAALEAEAAAAMQGGNEVGAVRIWGHILALQPRHVPTLSALGQLSYRKGDMAAARVAFQRLVDADGKVAQQWINLALACQGLRDEKGEEEAIRKALEIDPRDLLGLILRANLLEKQGKRHEAAVAYGAVSAVAPPLDRLHPSLRPAVTHAMQWRSLYDHECGAFMDAYLAPHLVRLDGERIKRFKDSLDIFVGRKKRYDSQSMMHHYPGLPTIEFFDREALPWSAAIEAAADDIRNEFLVVLAADQGFEPYINYADDAPVDQFAQLNHNPDWTAFHLIKSGKPVPQNAAKCPKTLAALKHAPQPDQPGRTPSAMFSLLKPKTRIPPHTGVSNVRLVSHLALIIPEHCALRVGNEIRQWVSGKVWAFDDTIEHEAWNNSDQLRVVLIFDIWHPHLSAAERELITAMSAGLNAFATGGDGFGL